MNHHHRLAMRNRSAVLALLTCVGLLAFAPTASAAEPKVTICHVTGSATNPYVQVTIGEKAVEANRTHQDGHDIIPAPATGCPGEPLPPIDVCPNILGDQASVPDGYVLDGLGNCVPVVDPPPPFISYVVSVGVEQTATVGDRNVR